MSAEVLKLTGAAFWHPPAQLVGFLLIDQLQPRELTAVDGNDGISHKTNHLNPLSKTVNIFEWGLELSWNGDFKMQNIKCLSHLRPIETAYDATYS